MIQRFTLLSGHIFQSYKPNLSKYFLRFFQKMRQQNLNNKTLNRKTKLVFTVFTRLLHDAGITGGYDCTQSFLEVAQSSGFTVSFMVNKQLSSADRQQQDRRGNRPETTGERRNRYHQSAVIDFFLLYNESLTRVRRIYTLL